MPTREELKERVLGYNEIAAHVMPNGELCLMLNHRATMDDAVMVRIRTDEDIIGLHEDEEKWEIVNQGGNWPHA